MSYDDVRQAALPLRPEQCAPVPLDLVLGVHGVEPPDWARGLKVTGITEDSRSVRPGDLFVGLPGRHVHGADFADRAARQGAVAMLSDRAHPALPTLVYDQPRTVVGSIGSAIYGNPSAHLQVVGVTGTNGKTTTVSLVGHLLRSHGRGTGTITTVGQDVGGRWTDSRCTTPEAPELQGTLARMVEAGCTTAVIEVSSHALALGRVSGTRFSIGVFTNLSRDHYDFHGGLTEYLAAKVSLFDPDRCDVAVINIDGDEGAYLARTVRCPVVTVSARGQPEADWRVSTVVRERWSSRCVITGRGERFPVTIPLPGSHNVENALAALAVVDTAGIPALQVAPEMTSFPGVPGRLERVDAGQPFLAVVDFAHNAAAIAATLRTLRCEVDGRLIVVFGAPGDRDPGKRPAMREAAAAGADVVVVTTDDPYDEDPLSIIADVMRGSDSATADVDYVVEPDRALAIERAVAMARPGDALVVAGRGHEHVQTARRSEVPFDDRLVLAQAIAASEYRW